MTKREFRKANRKIDRLKAMIISEAERKKKSKERIVKLAKEIDAILVADGFPSVVAKKIEEDLL